MGRAADTAVATVVPTIGVSLVILSLGLFAWLAELRGGSSLVTAALDPARAGSLPDLWGQLQLAAVAALLWSRRTTVPAAATVAILPLGLLVADVANLSANLAHPLAASIPPDEAAHPKLVAGLLIGGVALVPALALWRRSCSALRRLGRWLACTLVIAGVPSLALDWLGGSGGHRVAIVEETVELILYSAIAALLLGTLSRNRHLMGRVGEMCD